MSDALILMIPAFVECLVLVGIHSYLGLHVIKRKVIFVDLALAQIAALGTTVGFLFGMDPSSDAAFLFSMLFTFVGAAVFALTRLRKDKVPQEAVIGLVYALAAAIAILVVDKSPHGAEHVKDLMTGTILWVKWPEIMRAAIAYTFIGVVHFALRKRFIQITEDPDGAFAAGVWVRFWDFLFYLSFGFVISFSVRTAGVLLVFVFLVAPAISATLLTDKWRYQLLVGWAMGTLVTSLALYLSYVLDIPSGPAVVAFYGLVLLVLALIVSVVKAEKRGKASLRLAIGLGVAMAVLSGIWGVGHLLGTSELAHDSAHHLRAHTRHKHHPHHEHGKHAKGAHDGKAVTPQAAQAADPMARVQLLRKLAQAKTKGWKDALVQALADKDLPLFFKEQVLGLVKEAAKEDFGYRASASAQENAKALAALRAWAKL
ncbi:MAG: metal ABC transporter permease [Deltaproteobacteria bacterium]|nr:metal ABC transporter permease [Deltaproteobacteria bacterium]